MADEAFVNAPDTEKYLGDDVLSLTFLQFQPLVLNEASQGAIFTKFHQKVKIQLVLKCSIQLDNLWNFFQLSKNVSLVEHTIHEIRPRCLIVLHNYLACKQFARLLLLYLVDLTERALTQEFYHLKLIYSDLPLAILTTALSFTVNPILDLLVL